VCCSGHRGSIEWTPQIVKLHVKFAQLNSFVIAFLVLCSLGPSSFLLYLICYHVFVFIYFCCLFNDALTILYFTMGSGASWDSAVGIATGYGLDHREVRVRVPVGPRIFSSPRCPDRLWGPPTYPMGNGDSFPGGKAAGA
jgi:hypothetical protein